MDGGDSLYSDLNRSLDSASSELDALRLNSREATLSDRGLARSQKLEDAILSEIKKTVALGSNTLDLSNKGLLQIPDEILKMPTLEYLYLEGNELSFLPDEFFDCLPNLKWLDLRRNSLSRIPSVYLGRHRNLRNLLLEENNIKSLPLELGLVKSVSGLNINNNPLEFPPVDVLEKGTQEILKFLYEMLQAKLASKSGDFDEDIPTYDEFDSDQSDEEWLDDYRQGHLQSRESNLRGARQSGLGGPVPQSAELHHQISYSDRKLLHTEKLKQAGALGIVDGSFLRRKLLSQQQRKAKFVKQQSASATSNRSKKKSAKESKMNWRVNQYPAPPSHDFVDIKMAEERKMAKVKELKERQDAILQRRRDEQALKDWRDDSKKLQHKKYLQAVQNGGLEYDEPAKKAPFAVEKNHMKVLSKEEQIKSEVKEAHEKIRRPMSPGTKQRIEAEKTARIRELEKRIKEHSNNMLERRKQPKGTPQHEMEAAKKELDVVYIELHKDNLSVSTAEILQRELKVQRTELEYRFKAFTGDITSGYTKTTKLKS
ncbi:hypothetical protein LOTGIDRAFT_236873 [Lottia gigantea]|uniref:Leucine-rich repeat-containing protein 27 n=1 Tax=Lottia gigantea TaxID=225164 RepID=V4B3W9_LOTGI|nr:hypothetical protein LOTGIDRAFT_236873 [Lottia gigantea]ESO83099.1 hypothetical protein LOTGIDRAFT_236873 [Lottia gigantea]